jgi:3-hydroxybutyryl-CoA dehydrogenase
MNKVAVIGSGTMGNGIAHVFGQNGYSVNLIDVSSEALDRALATIGKNLDRQIKKQLITEAEKASTLENITTFNSIKEGAADVDLVVEAATENVDLKLKIFKELDETCKADCLLATNTSSISLTKIASATSRPDKVIGMHFMNPVPVMKLVEVIRGYNTSDQVTQTIMELSENWARYLLKSTTIPALSPIEF